MHNTHISLTFAQVINNHLQQSIYYKEDKLVLELQPVDFATLQAWCIADLIQLQHTSESNPTTNRPPATNRTIPKYERAINFNVQQGS